MITNREIISKFRKRIQEKDADSTYTNKFLYSVLKEHARWLIKREISAGRIYNSKNLFQTHYCMDVVKASKVTDCCPIKTNCKVFRTRTKLDESWTDEFGPVITFVSSIDGSVEFDVLSSKEYEKRKSNPYSKWDKGNYAFYNNGYLWFENSAPKKVNITFFPQEDISGKYGCDANCCEDDCVPFLDKRFMIPGWIEAELLDKAVSQILGTTKRAPEDNSIDKDSNERRP